MKKNDKIVVILGVVILVLASIGVFYYEIDSTKTGKTNIENFYKVTGSFKEDITGKSITISDSDPFYAMVVTPLAIHYDKDCNQVIIPMYIENETNPSDAIVDIKNEYLYPFDDLRINDLDFDSAQELSIKIADAYWEESEAALIIENSYHGYCMGLNAVPYASYCSIPVIVCDEFDSDVDSVLRSLDVQKLMVCGKNLEGYEDSYEYLCFEDIDQIVQSMADYVKDRFGDVGYITLANPVDAWPPEVITEEEFFFDKTVIPTSTMNDGMLKFLTSLSKGVFWDPIKIPEDYKYALVEITGINHNIDGVDEFGDRASFKFDPVDPDAAPLTGMNGISTADGHPERDGKGNIIKDFVYVERVLYDCGGKEYQLSAKGKWAADSEGEVSAMIRVKKLAHPVHAMMPKLSLMAPYLTAYHKGVVFAKPEFNFTADDDVVTDEGKTCPGFYMPGRNLELTPMSNRHVVDNIHKPLNDLLADIADLDIKHDSDLELLQNYYEKKPVYIAILGGATVIPRYYYDNDVEPLDDPYLYGFAGGGTQSDNIYGNIDPVKYDYSNMADDIYTEYPFMENIVGRIATYDGQDASALIARTVFYEDILQIARLSEWKENYGNLYGGGLDFKKPLFLHIISKLPGRSFIESLGGGLLDLHGPWKLETGFGEIGAQAINYKIGENLGFENIHLAYDSEAMREGLTDEALHEIKAKSLRNKLFFDEKGLKELVGEGNVKGGEILENSNFVFLTAHGAQHNFGMPGPELVASGFKGLFGIVNWQKYIEKLIPLFAGGFWGPGGEADKVGDYTSRSIAELDLGPSFLWLESCFLGRINGLYGRSTICPSFIHAGANAVIGSSTGSNIPGGYLEEKTRMFDLPLETTRKFKQAQADAEQNIFPDFHFGVKIYEDLCNNLKDMDCSIGLAFRDAKNVYLPEDAEWELWWNPPLSSGEDSGYGDHVSAKYTSYHEYVLYGDPAFNPYVPGE